jgi:prepilin-type N-terminal cleavage/methylation domain-containing protein
MGKTHAFSLIEMMVVVAIVGVGASIAVPQISESTRRANAPVQAVRVQGYLTEARNLARRTKEAKCACASNRSAALSFSPDLRCIKVSVTIQICPLSSVKRSSCNASFSCVELAAADDDVASIIHLRRVKRLNWMRR